MNVVPTINDPMMRLGSVNYTLTNAVTDYNIDALEGEVTESVIDGTVSMIYKGKRFEGEISVYGVTLANYDIYRSMQRQTVRLWPFGAGFITGTSPARYYPWVDVFVISVTPFHKDNALYHDAVIIKFKSLGYYELARATELGYGA